MYDELVKELRDSAEWADRLALLMGRAEGDAHAPIMRKAAEAIEELSKRVHVLPHGRLKRRLVYRGEVYNALESARVNALDGILSDPYKEGFHDGIKRAIQILANEVNDAPTIIPASEEAGE